MTIALKSRILPALALLSGLIVLAGYFIELPWLLVLQRQLLGWTMILAAFATVLGVVNLARVHWGKIAARRPGWGNSLVLLAVLAVTLALGLLYGPTAKPAAWIFSSIVAPIEISLLAGLAVSLGLLAARMVTRERSWFRVVLLATALLIMIGSAAASSDMLAGFNAVPMWISQVLAVGGARGLLLGIALGALAAGLRAIAGIDRPYGGGP